MAGAAIFPFISSMNCPGQPAEQFIGFHSFTYRASAWSPVQSTKPLSIDCLSSFTSFIHHSNQFKEWFVDFTLFAWWLVCFFALASLWRSPWRPAAHNRRRQRIQQSKPTSLFRSSNKNKIILFFFVGSLRSSARMKPFTPLIHSFSWAANAAAHFISIILPIRKRRMKWNESVADGPRRYYRRNQPIVFHNSKQSFSLLQTTGIFLL